MVRPNEIEALFDRLWPLNRSLTGDNNRKTLEILSEVSDLQVIEVPSGKTVLDWTIPPEYKVSEAYIEDESGYRIIDFNENNLHLVGYSIPVETIISYDELIKKLHFIKEMPDAIPYVTSYYESDWGFCISYNHLKRILKNQNYKVVIRSSFDPQGSMTIGQRLLKGKVKKEILISTYICHPSMANNELSGPLLSIFLQREIEKLDDRYFTYRFVYIPETIGAINILHEYGEHLKNHLVGGLVATCVGDSGWPMYKKSRRGDTRFDRMAIYTLSKRHKQYEVLDFFPTGSDERQYCSPAFNLPVGSLMRTMYTRYKEYHTSLDNKSIMDFDKMVDLIKTYFDIIVAFRFVRTYKYLDGKGEPFLKGRSLVQGKGAQKKVPQLVNHILWCLSLADGENDTLDIAVKTGLELQDVYETCVLLEKNNLLKEIR